MKFRALKWLTMALAPAALAALSLATNSTEAEACFGRCCGSGWGGYRPIYYRPAYYGPIGRCGAGCWSGCSTGCSPCGLACSPCGSGDCGIAPPAGKLSPTPNPNWKESERQTYAPEGTAPPAGSNSNSGASGRTEPDSSIEQETRRAEESAPATPIQKKATSAGDGSDAGGSSGSSTGKKKGPAIDRVDEFDARTGPVPTISIDEKIVWRPAPVRKRSEIPGHVASARLVRVPAYAKSGWLPAVEGSSVAKK